MLRFKVGELARTIRSAWPGLTGVVVEVEAIGPFKAGDRWDEMTISEKNDYIISCRGEIFACMDSSLLKLGDPDQQVTRQAEDEVAA